MLIPANSCENTTKNMLFFNLRRRLSITLLALILLNSFDFAEARTISSSAFFKGKHKAKVIYGSVNNWDNRVCAVVDNKVVMGRLNNSDSNTVILAGKKVVITDYIPQNPNGFREMSGMWLKNKKFMECYQKVSYAICTIEADSKYYDTSDEFFRGRIGSTTRVFVSGENTTSYSYMEDEEKKIDENWADFSFSLNGKSTSFITVVKNINCKSS
jgi:hypothetical protein